MHIFKAPSSLFDCYRIKHNSDYTIITLALGRAAQHNYNSIRNIVTHDIHLRGRISMLHAEEIALGEEPTFPKHGTPMENIEWLCKWSELVYQVPITPQVPQSASAINTSLVASNWRLMLRSYPHRAMAPFVFTRNNKRIPHRL